MEKINKPYVEERVKDRKNRISSLYSFVEKTLSGMENIECKKKRFATMYEGLMDEYKVKAEKLPILDIYKKKKLIAAIRPKGLWVVGANGRIDILTHSGSYIVVDTAEKLKKPKWQVFLLLDKRSGKKMMRKWILL